MFEAIERLKAEWTDKYVVIDSPAAELARFAGVTGTVRTVNMNGRCLVEFDQYSNIGWYDIDPACLKIIPEPLPKPEPKAKPAPKAAAPAAKAGKPAKAAAGKRPSTADILAAARGKAAAPKPAPAKAGGKLSTAEILAAARGKAAVAPAEAPPQPEPEPAPEPEVAAEAAPEPAAETAAPAAADGPLPTTTAEKIAWCRQHDAKG
jgi:hypothetical protein